MVDTLQDQAAMGERARIARDLHDVVAHHVSAIAVQAESARLTTEGLPEEGKAHFEAIGQTARDALTEMRRLLGVLREDASAEPTRDPQPSLARLNELVETARAAGTPVTLTLEGAVTPFASALPHHTLDCQRGVTEVAFFHAASRTLALVDSAFNLRSAERWIDRVVWSAYGALGRFGPTATARMFLLRDRAAVAAWIEALCAWPFERVVVAHDICNKHRLRGRGGHGYAHLIENVVPMMRRKGMALEQVETVFIANPARVLAFA